MENRISKITLAACLTMLVGLTGFTGSVMANTPDGETPANEAVCDNLMGATPGLYGLCVAYCEAQDLDMVGEAKMPNSKILVNYRKKMQASDPDMPCIAVTSCPCLEDTDLPYDSSALCDIGDTTAQYRSSNLFAQANTNDPGLCRFAEKSTRTQRLNANLTVDEASACYSAIVAACTAP